MEFKFHSLSEPCCRWALCVPQETPLFTLPKYQFPSVSFLLLIKIRPPSC